MLLQLGQAVAASQHDDFVSALLQLRAVNAPDHTRADDQDPHALTYAMSAGIIVASDQGDLALIATVTAATHPGAHLRPGRLNG